MTNTLLAAVLLMSVAIFIQLDIQNQKTDEYRSEVNACLNNN